MKLYLDDNIAYPLLARLLRKAGHDVQLPADVNLSGKPDAVHLTHSIREGRVCLTPDYTDFENLHLLVKQAQGHYPGIIVVRRDDDPKRNLSPHDIVRALRNLESAGVPIADEYHILNHWQ